MELVCYVINYLVLKCRCGTILKYNLPYELTCGVLWKDEVITKSVQILKHFNDYKYNFTTLGMDCIPHHIRRNSYIQTGKIFEFEIRSNIVPLMMQFTYL
jgi:hypothetical protein